MISSLVRRSLTSISPSSTNRATSILSKLPSSFQISDPILQALHSNKPIVALESTIITHGLPSNDDPTNPTNLKCALQLEQTVRENGAIPATIALMDGKVMIGLNQDQLIRLADSPNQSDSKPIKTGERDVANVLAMGNGAVGGTTVSGTLFLAHLAGIKHFATGGIGGVHRGGEISLDISADLSALSRHPISLFCSGAKSILDIPRTLEFLETAGVPVSTFSESGQFPAFYTSKSGCKVSKISSMKEAARVILEQERLYNPFSSNSNSNSNSNLNFSPGHLFSIPIPESFEEQGLEIQKAVEKAVLESKENGMDKKGKEVTPWLLGRVNQLTGSKSLESNLGLVINNSKIASQVAVEVENLRRVFDEEVGKKSFRGVDFKRDVKQITSNQGSILVFGLAAIDLTSQFNKDSLKSSSSVSFKQATTYPGKVRVSLGGVGRNIAESSNRLLFSLTIGNDPITQLIAPIGEKDFDPFAKVLLDGLKRSGMRVDGLFNSKKKLTTESKGKRIEEGKENTPVCSLLLDSDGDLINGVADMNAAESLNSKKISEVFQRFQFQRQENEKLTIAMDANLSVESMVQILEEVSTLRKAGNPTTLLFEPTSISKSVRILNAFKKFTSPSKSNSTSNLISISTPNEIELIKLFEEAKKLNLIPSHDHFKIKSEREQELLEMSKRFELSHFTLMAAEFLSKIGYLGELILIKLGSRGVLSIQRSSSSSGNEDEVEEIRMKLHPIPKVLSSDLELNTTGAGDTFAGAVLACSHLSKNEPGLWNERFLEGVVRIGQKASAMTLLSKDAVAPEVENLGEELKELFVNRDH